LKENADFRRDAFKDDQHFVWKINPLRFMQESGLKSVTSSLTTDNKPVINSLPTGTKIVNQPPPTVNQFDTNHVTIGVESPKPVTKTDNNTGNSGNGFDNKPVEKSIERELIDVLKDQIKVKDGQLKDQGEQLKETHELNMKLTGTMLQQSQKIETLLRVTGGKSEAVEMDIVDHSESTAANA
jgi:hypothetical protein